MPLWDRKKIVSVAVMLHCCMPGLALYHLHDGTLIEISYAVNEYGEVLNINNVRIPNYADLDDHIIDYNVSDLY